MKLIIVLCLVTIVVADEFNKTVDTTDELKNNNQIAPRKRIHKIFHRHGLWLAGLHALGIFTAIKFKLFIIVLAIGFTIFFGIKAYAGKSLLGGFGGCPPPPPPPPFIHEATPYIPFEHDHHTGFDHGGYVDHPPPFDQGGAFSNPLPNTEPYNAYGPYGGTSAPGSSTPDISSDHSYSRVSKQKRDLDDGYRFSDIAFTFLGVNSKECRKRFVCEMELKSKKHPLSRMAFEFLSDTFLATYRTIGEKARSIKDCEHKYSGCVTNLPTNEEEGGIETNIVKESRDAEMSTTTIKSKESTKEGGRIILKRGDKSSTEKV